MISFWSRLLDLISPRACAVCGRRLAVGEQMLCTPCLLHLPRTGFQQNPYRNEMAQAFWLQIPVERAAAWFYYEAHSAVGDIYKHHPEMCEQAGRMLAEELRDSGFFEGIDLMIPVPLARRRRRERGYNQSEEIAKGISAVIGIPVSTDHLYRKDFHESQTQKDRWARHENVKDTFQIKDAAALKGRHVLLIDDVVTTGATVLACGSALMQVEGIRISVLSLGYTKS